MRLVLPVLLLVLLPALPVRAEDGPAPAKPPVRPKAAQPDIHEQVSRWLEELRSEDFEVRETARRSLRARGLQARDVLEGAKDDADPEVRRTVRAILARAPAKPTLTAAQVTPGDFRGIGRLSLKAQDEPLQDILARVDEALGSRIEPPEALLQKALTLDLTDAPCYDVLAAIQKATLTRPQQPFDRSGRMLLVAADPRVKRAPRGAVGPMQITVLEVAATRAFGVETLPRYALKLRLEWAPFVQVGQYDRPTVEVARDPDGKRYRATAAMARNASYGVGTTVKHHTTTVHLEPAEVDCKQMLAALELSVQMRLQHDRVTVKLDDLSKTPCCLGPDGKPAKPGSNESVQFHSVAQAEGGRGQWVVDFTATLLDEKARRNLQAFLVEEDGSTRQVSVYGGRSIGADGTVRITARAYRGTRGKPKALRVSWFRREEQGSLRFRIEDIPLR